MPFYYVYVDGSSAASPAIATAAAGMAGMGESAQHVTLGRLVLFLLYYLSFGITSFFFWILRF